MIIRLTLVAFLIAVSTFFLNAQGSCEVFLAKDEALKHAFPEATKVKTKILYITKEQSSKIIELSGVELTSKLYTLYLGYKGKDFLGYAAIESATVRSLPATYMVHLDPQGEIIEVVILAFHEPLDYLPTQSWLKQFEQKKDPVTTRLRQAIAGIAGSTLSARSIEKGARKVLAIYSVMLGNK